MNTVSAQSVAYTFAIALLFVPFGAAAQFKIPPIPGWTDVSPGAPEENFRQLTADELGMARSDRYTALAFDKRQEGLSGLPVFQVLLMDGALPIQDKVPDDLVQGIVASVNARLVSATIVRSTAGPRLRIELDAKYGVAEVRQVQFAIPGPFKSAFAVYTVPRNQAKRYLREIDAHAARIIPTQEGPWKPDGAPPALCHAVQTGNLDGIRRAVAGGADVAAECTIVTPLAVAAKAGDIKTARLLLDLGANVNQPFGLPLRTPLMQAAMNGQLEMVKLLLQAGADVNARNKFGRTALYYTETPTPPLIPPSNAAEIAAYLRKHGAVF